MTTQTAWRFAVVAAAVLFASDAWRAKAAERQAAERKIEKRAAWTTSRISGSPEPQLPYTTEPAFPALTFKECLDITSAPGTDRLFVVEQSGKIFSFPNRPDVEAADLVIDVAKEIEDVQQVYALTFDPGFEQNRYCYICYLKAPNLEDGSHVARFRMSETDPPTIDAASEKTVITWLSGGHNGCCLRFGPDGCLYISTGDGGAPNPPDPLKAGQDTSNLLSAILRIDVSHADDAGEQPYRVPSDNPFVDLAGTRGEIWAYGFRNPWRMSFDRRTGDLWVGDVGWELWEMLDRVERGGNYGWGVMEGRQPTNPEWPRGPTPILPPTLDHPHSESSSITDGLTYYGKRLKDLYGTHLYGDYDTGKFWGFRYVNGRVVDHRELADTTHRVVAFGEDRDGECYVLDHTAGTVHRLASNPRYGEESAFPRTLSESGLFSSVGGHEPAPGVVRYSINAEPWADYAASERLAAVPGEGSIGADGAAWTFPKDTVLAKTLSLEMERGNPASRRRIETQILHFDGSEWQPYTYQWNDEETDATLVGAAGAERAFDVADLEAPGGTRRQTWRFAGRAECQRCHNKWSGPALAFNAPQLNKQIAAGGSAISQISYLAAIGLLDPPPPAGDLPHLADPRDESAGLDDRARAYLQSNCAHCHRMHAGSAVLSKMHYDLPLEQTDMVGVRPTQGTFGIHAAQVVAAGDPFRSVLLYRMAKLGGGRMPHIGSTEVDRGGIDLICNWIRQVPKSAARAAQPAAPGEAAAESGAPGSSDTVAASGDASAARLRAEETAALDALIAAELPADQAALVAKLLASTSGALMLLRAIDDRMLPPAAAALAVEQAAAHEEVSIRDLFERFLPAERRTKRLGSVVQADQILSLPGEAGRGQQVFFATAGVQCRNCHRIRQEGKEVGPDLTAIGKKYNREQLLESILAPSKFIDPKYVTYLIETTDGRTLTGLLVTKDDRQVVLKDAQNMELRVPVPEIEQLVAQQQSLMPEPLVRDMTAQQVADLLAYLSSLK